jgi:UDP-N-acetylglucosamine 1-carboxyvinyltransferase
VSVPGFKHSLVACVAAAALADAPVRLENCPDIEETRVLAQLITQLGGTARIEDGALAIDCTGIDSADLPDEDVARIHGSVYLMPALLGRFGKVWMPGSGGCRIGDEPGRRRPVRQYVEVFQRFGATASEDPADGTVTVTAAQLTGCEIDLLDFTTDRELRTGPLYSGATKTALLTAAVATGTSVIHAPYPKPDVTELVAVLRALGVDVETTAGGSYVVHGHGAPPAGRPVRHVLVPDLIAIMTWICAGALLAETPMTVRGERMTDAAGALAPERAVLDALGVRVDWGERTCVVHPIGELAPVDVVVASHGVFSDSQPLLALLAAQADGQSVITETVWTGRFTYADGFEALGMDVKAQGAQLRIRGPWQSGPGTRQIVAHDLRAAAALLLASLATPGTTVLTGMGHLARGYPDLPGELLRTGADIREGAAS